MACTITNYTASCDNGNAGGILKVYVANPSDVVFTYDANGDITATAFATGTCWRTIDIREQFANYTEPRTGDFTARTKLFTGTLTIGILRRSKALRDWLMSLEACNCGLVVGWEEAAGAKFVMGDQSYARAFFADGTQGETGAAFNDANQEQVVFQAQMLTKAPNLTIAFQVIPTP